MQPKKMIFAFLKTMTIKDAVTNSFCKKHLGSFRGQETQATSSPSRSQRHEPFSQALGGLMRAGLGRAREAGRGAGRGGQLQHCSQAPSGRGGPLLCPVDS